MNNNPKVQVILVQRKVGNQPIYSYRIQKLIGDVVVQIGETARYHVGDSITEEQARIVAGLRNTYEVTVTEKASKQ